MSKGNWAAYVANKAVAAGVGALSLAQLVNGQTDNTTSAPTPAPPPTDEPPYSDRTTAQLAATFIMIGACFCVGSIMTCLCAADNKRNQRQKERSLRARVEQTREQMMLNL